MDERREIDTPLTVVIGLVGAIVTFAIVVALQGLFRRADQQEFTRKIVDQAPHELEALRAEQLEALSGYRWVDRGKGVVTVPIDRAIELELRDLSSAPRSRRSGR